MVARISRFSDNDTTMGHWKLAMCHDANLLSMVASLYGDSVFVEMFIYDGIKHCNPVFKKILSTQFKVWESEWRYSKTTRSECKTSDFWNARLLMATDQV